MLGAIKITQETHCLAEMKMAMIKTMIYFYLRNNKSESLEISNATKNQSTIDKLWRAVQFIAFLIMHALTSCHSCCVHSLPDLC